MSQGTKVILLEFAESDAMQKLACELAARGDSIGIAWQPAKTSEDAIDRFQLLLEHAGCISCAIKLEQNRTDAIERAIGKMIDLFGRVDEVVCFSKSLAEDAARTIAKMPSRQRPRFVVPPLVETKSDP